MSSKVMLLVALIPACVRAQAEADAASRPQTSATRPADGAPGTAAGGWRQWRGDPLNSAFSRGKAPEFKGIKWRFIADSEIVNSPVYADGVVYVGSRGGMLHAIDAAAGKRVWSVRHIPAVEGAQTPGFTFSAPLVFEDRICIGAEDGNVHCVARSDGHSLWKVSLGGEGDTARVWSSPKTDGKLVFVGSLSGYVYAIDPMKGDVRWKVALGDSIAGSLAIVGGKQGIVPGKDKRLHVIDLEKGVESWRCDVPGWSMAAPSVALGYAFMQTRGNHFIAVDLVARKVAWDYDEMPSNTYFQPSPCCDGDRCYVTNGANVVAIDTQTGARAWIFKGRGPYDCSPTMVGDFIVFGGNDQALTALDKKTGDVAKQVFLGEKILSTPCIVDGIAYVAGNSGTVFAVE